MSSVISGSDDPYNYRPNEAAFWYRNVLNVEPTNRSLILKESRNRARSPLEIAVDQPNQPLAPSPPGIPPSPPVEGRNQSDSSEPESSELQDAAVKELEQKDEVVEEIPQEKEDMNWLNHMHREVELSLQNNTETESSTETQQARDASSSLKEETENTKFAQLKQEAEEGALSLLRLAEQAKQNARTAFEVTHDIHELKRNLEILISDAPDLTLRELAMIHEINEQVIEIVLTEHMNLMLQNGRWVKSNNVSRIQKPNSTYKENIGSCAPEYVSESDLKREYPAAPARTLPAFAAYDDYENWDDNSNNSNNNNNNNNNNSNTNNNDNDNNSSIFPTERGAKRARFD